MNRVHIGGPAAELRWGYHPAATLGRWDVHADAGQATLTATVASADTLRVSQRPLTFVVPRPDRAAWRWPVTTLQIVDGTLTAVLGPQE